eukprot:2460465-Pleurochrysis_carterae.AAC.2
MNTSSNELRKQGAHGKQRHTCVKVKDAERSQPMGFMQEDSRRDGGAKKEGENGMPEKGGGKRANDLAFLPHIVSILCAPALSRARSRALALARSLSRAIITRASEGEQDREKEETLQAGRQIAVR